MSWENKLESAQTIQHNIHRRQQAEAAFEQCRQLAKEGMAAGWPDDGRYWEELVRLVCQYRPALSDKVELAAMGYDEAREFSREKLSFGVHRGQQVGDVPLRYLEWLTRQSLEFPVRLRAYLRSSYAEQAHPSEHEGGDDA